jgi:sugar O-acyltransferase (sialic acid O-acetyltransferase NeuD family)
MTKGRLLIIGAGGHGRVVADCALASKRWDEIVFFDDRWPALARNVVWPVIGKVDTVATFARESDEIFVAIGRASARIALLSCFREGGMRIATIIHPHTSVSPETKIGSGTIVVSGAVINIGATAGMGCIINTSCSVDHDCVLGEGVHICPGSRLAGDVHVGAQSWIGIGAVIRQGIRIGLNVTVGAGAAVVADVADGLTVVGVPARPR